jgi:hypothetical protein
MALFGPKGLSVSDRVLAGVTLSATLGVIAYGTSVAFDYAATSDRAKYVLEFADGKKAIFRDPDITLRVVRIGSPLPGAGSVTEITNDAGVWKVATSKGLVFTKE